MEDSTSVIFPSCGQELALRANLDLYPSNCARKSILTVTEGVGHGLVPTVWQGPVAPAVGPLSSRLIALVSPALPGADADDPVHQLALGLLLFQVVVLGDAVDELADLVGLAGEGRVGGALGQLVDLMQRVELQQLLGDQRVNVRARVAHVQVVVFTRQKAGVARRPLALPFPWGADPLGGRNWVPDCATRDAHIWVTEAVVRGQLGGFGRLAGLQRKTTCGVGYSHAVRWVRFASSFGGVVCGALVDRQAGLPAAVESTREHAADKSLAAAPAHGGAGAAGMSVAGGAVC